MKLFIKNMVCSRCKMVVKSELIKFGLHPASIELGEIEITEELNEQTKNQLNQVLLSFGFALIDNKNIRTIEKVKNLIVDLVQNRNNKIKTNLSDYLSDRLHLEYTSITHLFTQVEGTTIEQYFIALKIERVKELLVYNEFSLSEIAFQLNYSSVSHLSKQFKKVTGLTPSHFKQLRENKRKPLEAL